MAQWLGALVVLPEDPSLTPSIHTMSHDPCITPVPEDPTPFSGLRGHRHTYSTQIYMQATFVQIKIAFIRSIRRKKTPGWIIAGSLLTCSVIFLA